MRRWLRSGLAALFFAGFGLGSLVIGSVLFPFLLVFAGTRKAQRGVRRLVRFTYRFFVWCADVSGLFTVRLQPDDRARLARLRGYVIVMNHLSLIDIIILIALLPDSTAVAKAAAGRNFFYSRIVRAAFLSNADPVRVLDEARGLLREGVNVIVFPEGTRTPPGPQVRTLRRGAAQLALHAQVPIAALFMRCSPPVLDKRRPWYAVGSRTIVYRIVLRGEIAVSAEPSHKAAVALTREIGARLFG